MTKTATRISFGLYNLQIKGDSSLACNSLQPFAQLADLTRDNATTRPYASYEPDFWLLDGNYKFLPADTRTVHVGLMSLLMSGADGAFNPTYPILTVTFSTPQSTESLSLRFSPVTGDYASLVTVAYYDAGNALIRSDIYSPESAEFSTDQAVSNFSKITITFHATNRPYRYLRLTGLDYGELISFAGSAVQGAHLVEEVDQLSGELPYNSLDLRLYSADAAFSILNPSGNYATLAERQPLDVYELVDGATVYIGRFYLDEWENLSDTDYQFRAIDLLGVLDRQTYRGGLWSGISLGDLLEAVLGAASVPYELDSELVGETVSGWLPQGSYRAALQQIGFAVGASVTCSRSGVVKIFKSRIAASASPDSTITRAQKGQDQSLALQPLVTGVEVTAHSYQPGGEAQVVVSGTLAAGLHEFAFSEPMHALSVSGATVVAWGVNYAELLVVTPGTVTLTGLKYIDTTSLVAIHTTGLPAGVRPNVLKVESATLVSPACAAAVAGRLYAYATQRYHQTVRLFAPEVEPGSVAVVDTLYNRQLRAVVEKMDIDLAGGFVASVEMTGVAQ